MCVTEPIRDKKDMKKLAGYFEKKGQIRNFAMVVVGFATGLRITDELNLTWGDVYDFENDRFRTHIDLTERKTKKTKQVKINYFAREALRKLLELRKKQGTAAAHNYIFSNGRGNENHISRVQAWRLITNAVKALAIPGNIACHSLRKTLGYYAWKYEHIPGIVIMGLYNHSSFDVTKRYLGIIQDDYDAVYDAMVL
ncbi:MAG: tyrosine-type recombinase/integrase [Flexilinea sp.]|nr:tyrosine-type recombinase/integrase [Flexilinea sp.]